MVVGLAFQLTRWSKDEWTSSTGDLLRKRRDITFTNIESGVKRHDKFVWVCVLETPANIWYSRF